MLFVPSLASLSELLIDCSESTMGSGDECGRHLERPWGRAGSDYEEHGIIGKGAYGIVYLVTHLASNKQYALKKIIVKITEDGIPQSIIREISALRALHHLDHPNIVKLHDVFHCLNGNDEMCLSVVYERCDWDLYDFLRSIPRDMGDAQCRHIARQIMLGLDFLHSNHVIHRDLKPQNILINRDQSVKIADFGLARYYSMQSSFTTLVVTLWYRSPEVLLQCSYNCGVDIWAAGCIIAELYSRQPLFPAQTEAQQLSVIFQKLGTPSLTDWPANAVIERSNYPSYPGLSFERLAPKLPPDAAKLIKSMLAFKPEARPSSAQVLRSEYMQRAQPLVFTTSHK
uniref:cyclin-dependent kinase n=2 Tax=Parascaris univalens TaxID=6257 RepID=A0A915A637_PARUN